MQTNNNNNNNNIPFNFDPARNVPPTGATIPPSSNNDMVVYHSQTGSVNSGTRQVDTFNINTNSNSTSSNLSRTTPSASNSTFSPIQLTKPDHKEVIDLCDDDDDMNYKPEIKDDKNNDISHRKVNEILKTDDKGIFANTDKQTQPGYKLPQDTKPKILFPHIPTSVSAMTVPGTGVHHPLGFNGAQVYFNPSLPVPQPQTRPRPQPRPQPEPRPNNKHSYLPISVVTVNQETNNVSEQPAPTTAKSVPLTSTTAIPLEDAKQPPKSAPPFAKYVDLSPIPKLPPLPKLTPVEQTELEKMLQFKKIDSHATLDSWRGDWSGNLQLMDKELVINRNKIARNSSVKPETIIFKDWVAQQAQGGSADDFKGIKFLFSFLYHFKNTPPMAKAILTCAICRKAKDQNEKIGFIASGVRRISYDPIVLQEDGWATEKADKPVGASGGAFLIGRRLYWQKYEAIVIAFVRDDEIGDLWKAMWFEDQETFDLEADELQEALKKYETRTARKKARLDMHKPVRSLSGNTTQKKQPNETRIGIKPPSGIKLSTSSRFAATANFIVDGIEDGIVLASSYYARNGILWPARVMHVSEINAQPTNRQRSSQKNNVSVVFLLPYWNAKAIKDTKKSSSYDSLFEMASVEVSPSTIQKYPYDVKSGSILVDELHQSFRFLGLPKSAFPRFFNSHRLALGLKMYARNTLNKMDHSGAGGGDHVNAFAALTESHVMSVKTACFPREVLDLPYGYMLSRLPPPLQQVSKPRSEDPEEITERILKIDQIIESMNPPLCWGQTICEDGTVTECIPHQINHLSTVKSPQPRPSMAISAIRSNNTSGPEEPNWTTAEFASEYLLKAIDNEGRYCHLNFSLTKLVQRLCHDIFLAKSEESNKQRDMLKSLLSYCLMVKGHGEDALYFASENTDLNVNNLVLEWRKACEKIYKCACNAFTLDGFGDEVTQVITDSRCNQHLTAAGSFERAVRLPAAITGAKRAGAGSKISIPLILKVEDTYVNIAEKDVLPRAHKASYLRRMKTKINSLPHDAKGVPLTDDSDGEGGEDTMGSRGSYMAAVVGVAATLKAVDMVVGGSCVNAFCAVRPPGHHAGKELRAMNAVSNGFCLFNAAACAALYAVKAQLEGGCGLKRVCVIDFDVHHGNGTQDILCSTHDSRFLYISLHAGGAHVNGYEDDVTDEYGKDFGRGAGVGAKQPEGIFPGRSGDTSPHPGVLNIPLGQKVTAHAIGNALVSQVSPAVRNFSPELMILSAGFDAHKCDPLGMGGLSAEDFGSVTEVCCQMAIKCCSGRVVSVLEGGYGVPCCQPKENLFLPPSLHKEKNIDFINELPPTMEDVVDAVVMQRLDKCHSEGFLECVQHHVSALARSNSRRFGKK